MSHLRSLDTGLASFIEMAITIQPNSASPLQAYRTGVGAEDQTLNSNAQPEQRNVRTSEKPATVYSPSLSAGIAFQQNGNPTFDIRAAGFAKFFGTGSDEGSMSLALGVIDPSAQTLSEGKSFDEVVFTARAVLDEGYRSYREQNDAFVSFKAIGRDAFAFFKDFDRRALNAVVIDESGQFTKDEKLFARNIMLQQQGLASGFYNGPSSLREEFADPFIGDTTAKLAAGAGFLDKVHPEEKASITHALDRANAEGGYKLLAQKNDRPITVEFSEDPLVILIREGIASLQEAAEFRHTRGTILSADDLRNQDWFAPFLEQFDRILSERASY